MLDKFENYNLTDDELKFAKAMRHWYRSDTSLYKDDKDNEHKVECEYQFWEELPHLIDAVHSVNLTDRENEKISCEKTIEMIGLREFLSGLQRSAFHWNCSRYRTRITQDKNYKKGDTSIMIGKKKIKITDDMEVGFCSNGEVYVYDNFVYFDCSRVFK